MMMMMIKKKKNQKWRNWCSSYRWYARTDVDDVGAPQGGWMGVEVEAEWVSGVVEGGLHMEI